jgi:hypothetical protein
MFPFPIAKPQGCDIQTFYGSTNSFLRFGWNKPRGVSHVYMMLIGGGADGNTTNGGGSGAVTVWYGAAQHVPDALSITVGPKANASNVYYYTTSGTPNTLLTANGTTNATGATATTAGPFAASGFYQSIAGQDGSTSVSASATTFLSGGADSAGSVVANYGYTTPSDNAGYFQMQPIIVGRGGSGNGKGGIGCGGGHNSAIGGQGLVLIASW